MQLKTEQYKGYAIKFAEKVLGGKKLVVGEFHSKVMGKLLGSNGYSKTFALDGCKKMIDRELKVKGV